MKTGEKIRVLRKQKGLSQKDLANELHVSHQTVSKWELDETMPELSFIVQLSEFFGVTTDYLLKGGEDYEVEKIAESENDDWEVSENRGFFSRSRSLLRLMEILVTPIYLAIGLVFGIWHPTWIIFLIPWLVDELVHWFRENQGRN